MFPRTRIQSAATALLGLVALFATPASAAEVVLRFGSINTENTAAYDQVLLPFAKAVEEESGGRIEVALKPLGGYGKPAELFIMVEKGAIEMAATVQGYHPGRFPQSSVMELPFMFDNSISGTSAMTYIRSTLTSSRIPLGPTSCPSQAFTFWTRPLYGARMVATSASAFARSASAIAL